MKRIESRLSKLEQRRSEREARAENPNLPPPWWRLLGATEEPDFTFAELLAAAEGSDPPSDERTGNVVDVDAEFAKILAEHERCKGN